MIALKGLYADGKVELLEEPQFISNAEVIVIILDTQKHVVQIGGLFKDSNIDNEQIEKDLYNLNAESASHL
jgi:hypothetical protein